MAEIDGAEEVANRLQNLRPIYFESKTDLIRKPRSLIRSTLEFAPEAKSKKLKGEVERINNILIKATQEYVYDVAVKQELVDRSLDLSDRLYQKYKDQHIEKIASREVRSKLGSRSRKAIETVRQQTLSKFKSGDKERAFRECAIKDAWRAVLTHELKDKMMFKFYAKSILDAAAVSHNDYSVIYENIKEIQMKHQSWTEPHFDEKTGDVIMKQVTGNLFNYSEYLQRGRGSDNEIVIGIQEKMLHMVFFLKEGYITTHAEHNNKIRTGNGIKTYEILSDVAHTLTPFVFDFEDLQGRYGTKYKSFHSFCNNVLVKSLERVNRTLGIDVEMVKRKKEGKKLNAVEFMLSDHDRKILRTQKINSEMMFDDEIPLGQTFGYYLALRHHFSRGGITNIESYAKSLNLRLEKGEYVFTDLSKETLLQKHQIHLDTITRILLLLRQYEDDLSNVLYFDDVYHVIRKLDEKSESGEDIRLGDDAIESLMALELKYIDRIEKRHPTLPEFADGPKSVKDFLPFAIRISDKLIEINTKNLKRHEKTINSSIAFGKADAFLFSDPIMNERFRNEFFVSKDIESSEEDKEEVKMPKSDRLLSSEENRALHYGVLDFEVGDNDIDYYDGKMISTHDGFNGKIVGIQADNGKNIIKILLDDDRIGRVTLPFTDDSNLKRYLNKFTQR